MVILHCCLPTITHCHTHVHMLIMIKPLITEHMHCVYVSECVIMCVGVKAERFVFLFKGDGWMCVCVSHPPLLQSASASDQM